MERMESGTGYQGRLIIDPKMFNTFERIGKDNPLVNVSTQIAGLRLPGASTLFPSLT